MTTSGRLMAAGMPAGQATQIGGEQHTALVAAGTTKAGALALADTGGLYVFTTVSSGKGALLPPAAGAADVSIYNGGSNSLLVYANGTDTINALTAGASFSVTNGKAAIFKSGVTQWVATLSA